MCSCELFSKPLHLHRRAWGRSEWLVTTPTPLSIQILRLLNSGLWSEPSTLLECWNYRGERGTCPTQHPSWWEKTGSEQTDKWAKHQTTSTLKKIARTWLRGCFRSGHDIYPSDEKDLAATVLKNKVFLCMFQLSPNFHAKVLFLYSVNV